MQTHDIYNTIKCEWLFDKYEYIQVNSVDCLQSICRKIVTYIVRCIDVSTAVKQQLRDVSRLGAGTHVPWVVKVVIVLLCGIFGGGGAEGQVVEQRQMQRGGSSLYNTENKKLIVMRI